LVHKTMETVLHLAQVGHVILIGRGSHIVTGKMPGVFHVRLVGLWEDRVAHVQEFYKLARAEAVEFVKKEDRVRGHYVKEYFNCDVEDPLLYHLVVNTSRVSYSEAARLIGGAALRHFQSCEAAQS
jgi:cytidylate kinase